eukprot:g12867.t1
MNYQDIVLLHRKWREAKERLKAVKRLLDTSRLESAKLSRLAVAKSRELNEARKEASRVPELTATVDRLMKAKRAVEKAHGEEGQRADEEQRRSKAWRAQVDKVSLQAVQNAEHCRVLSSENGELRAELKHVRALLEEAERRGAVAGSISEELRLKRIEAGLLAEELGAVRQDCGRLVQLISSTKEYSQFRRLWDDSGSLTRLNNARATSPCCAATTRESDGDGAWVTGGAGVATPFGTVGTPIPQGGGAWATTRGAVAASAPATTTTCWGQALRSEWASPSETIIGAVATSATPVEAAATATAVAAPEAENGCGSGEEEGGARTVLEGRRTLASSRWRRAAGTEFEGEGAPPPPSRRVSFSSPRGRNESSAAAVEVLDKAEVSKGRSEAENRDRACCAGQAGGGQCGCTVPGTRAEANATADGDGGVGGPSRTEAVRWGRMDLLTVLYPPPALDEGSGSQIDISAEVSMWVPQEAAGLCRRFVRDFDGYSGVPLDAQQHHLLRSLLLGLNASWRQSLARLDRRRYLGGDDRRQYRKISEMGRRWKEDNRPRAAKSNRVQRRRPRVPRKLQRLRRKEASQKSGRRERGEVRWPQWEKGGVLQTAETEGEQECSVNTARVVGSRR